MEIVMPFKVDLAYWLLTFNNLGYKISLEITSLNIALSVAMSIIQPNPIQTGSCADLDHR
jgi:hypothetical protein